MNSAFTKPENEFKVGSVKASIWSNPRETRDGKVFNSHKVIVDRVYRDASGEFKATSSLDVNDIPKAILALKKAYDYLMTQPPAEEEGTRSQGPPFRATVRPDVP